MYEVRLPCEQNHQSSAANNLVHLLGTGMLGGEKITKSANIKHAWYCGVVSLVSFVSVALDVLVSVLVCFLISRMLYIGMAVRSIACICALLLNKCCSVCIMVEIHPTAPHPTPPHPTLS